MVCPRAAKFWGSLSLPSRFKPDLGLFRTFRVNLSTPPGCGCRRPSPCVGACGNRTHVDQVQVTRLNHYTEQVPMGSNPSGTRQQHLAAYVQSLHLNFGLLCFQDLCRASNIDFVEEKCEDVARAAFLSLGIINFKRWHSPVSRQHFITACA